MATFDRHTTEHRDDDAAGMAKFLDDPRDSEAGLLATGSKRARRGFCGFRSWKTPAALVAIVVVVGLLWSNRGHAAAVAHHLTRPSPAAASDAAHDEAANPFLDPDHRVGINGQPVASANLACWRLDATVMEELHQVAEPTVRVLKGGRFISQDEQVNAPEPLCLVVALPQHLLDSEDLYVDEPVKGRGPDAIHMFLDSGHQVLTLPPLLPEQSQIPAFELHTNVSLVYTANIEVLNAGSYDIVGEVEFRNWRWAQEFHADYSKLPGKIYPVRGDFDYYKEHNPKDLPWDFRPTPLPKFTLQVGGGTDLVKKAKCNSYVGAGKGRWYKAADYPDLKVSDNYVDEWGYTWQGDDCHLDPFTPEEVFECLGDKVIHFYGDSNVRRLSKAIMNGGHWCMDPHGRCQDEDDNPGEPVPKGELGPDGKAVFTTFERKMHYQGGDVSPITWGKNTTSYFSFVSVITNMTSEWMDRLYDNKDLIVQDTYGSPEHRDTYEDRELKSTALARSPPDIPKADLVIFGPGSWDQAFTERYQSFANRIHTLKFAFLKAYRGVPFVLRLSNQFCCRMPAGLRRFNGPRIGEFDDRVRRIFEVNGNKAENGRVQVLDPIMMNGRPDSIFDIHTSNANHPRASHVRMEAEMFFNSVCKRDPRSGKVVFRSQEELMGPLR